MLGYNQVEFSSFPNSRAKNSSCSSPSGFIIELIRDLWVTHIFAKFGADWSMFAGARVKSKSIKAVFLIQGQITLIALF